MRLPRTTTARPGYAATRFNVIVPPAAGAGRGVGVQPSGVDIFCILSKAAGCLPICLTGNVPACVACAGPGILSCL